MHNKYIRRLRTGGGVTPELHATVWCHLRCTLVLNSWRLVNVEVHPFTKWKTSLDASTRSPCTCFDKTLHAHALTQSTELEVLPSDFLTSACIHEDTNQYNKGTIEMCSGVRCIYMHIPALVYIFQAYVDVRSAKSINHTQVYHICTKSKSRNCTYLLMATSCIEYLELVCKKYCLPDKHGPPR